TANVYNKFREVEEKMRTRRVELHKISRNSRLDRAVAARRGFHIIRGSTLQKVSPVSTAVATDYTAPLLGGEHHFLLRRLHSLTGIVFGGYLIVHLLVNATIAQFGSVYQVQVNKIHDLPVLWALEWGLIYLPILYHTVYGIWITVTSQPNLNRYPY